MSILDIPSRDTLWPAFFNDIANARATSVRSSSIVVDVPEIEQGLGVFAPVGYRTVVLHVTQRFVGRFQKRQKGVLELAVEDSIVSVLVPIFGRLLPVFLQMLFKRLWILEVRLEDVGYLLLSETVIFVEVDDREPGLGVLEEVRNSFRTIKVLFANGTLAVAIWMVCEIILFTLFCWHSLDKQRGGSCAYRIEFGESNLAFG